MIRSDLNKGRYVQYSLREVRWFFNVPVNHFREEKGDRAYGLLFLPENIVVSHN